MPDEDGRLTDEDNGLIERWWAQHSKDPVICPVCKTSGWKIAGHLVNIQTYAADVGNTPAHPHVIISCKFCAHSLFFNAVQIGVVATDMPSDRQPNAA